MQTDDKPALAQKMVSELRALAAKARDPESITPEDDERFDWIKAAGEELVHYLPDKKTQAEFRKLKEDFLDAWIHETNRKRLELAKTEKHKCPPFAPILPSSPDFERLMDKFFTFRRTCLLHWTGHTSGFSFNHIQDAISYKLMEITRNVGQRPSDYLSGFEHEVAHYFGFAEKPSEWKGSTSELAGKIAKVVIEAKSRKEFEEKYPDIRRPKHLENLTKDGVKGPVTLDTFSEDEKAIRAWAEKNLPSATTRPDLAPVVKAYVRGKGRNKAEEVNRALRTGESLESLGRKDLVELERCLRKNKLPRPVQVSRGMFVLDGKVPWKVGDVVEDKGFCSTSLDEKIGRSFTLHADDYGVLCKIMLPKGTPGMLMPETPQWASDESEFLLPPGARFRIDKIIPRGKEGNSRHVVHMTVVSG
jgi:hypothetical protein